MIAETPGLEGPMFDGPMFDGPVPWELLDLSEFRMQDEDTSPLDIAAMTAEEAAQYVAAKDCWAAYQRNSSRLEA